MIKRQKGKFLNEDKKGQKPTVVCVSLFFRDLSYRYVGDHIEISARCENSNFKSIYFKKSVVLQSNSCSLMESEHICFS
jgi:hypothetical protein